MQTQYERPTDGQWEIIKHFVDWKRKRKVCLRKVLDSISFVTRTGIQWRNLKGVKDAPAWSAVYYYFDKWPKGGTFGWMDICLDIPERLPLGRLPFPSLGPVDPQGVKLAPDDI